MMGEAAVATVARHVDGGRVLRRLQELARIGAEPDSGVTRLAFSSQERLATDLVAGWMCDAGLTVAFDPFGNLFGSTDHNTPGRAVSMAGSHLDTVPHGGRFDGALGVVAALESVAAMRAADLMPVTPLEVVVWRCEEPVRFSQGKVGSLLFTGQITPEQLQPIEDLPLDLASELARDGARPKRALGRRVRTCLELHIEQGSRLERMGVSIGVVTAVAAPVRLRVEVKGRSDHSGATPMSERRDALTAAAEMVLAVERAGRDEARHGTVATTAAVECLPGAMNVIPGWVTMLVDVRGVDEISMQRLIDTIERSARVVECERGVEVGIEILSRGTPTRFRGSTVQELERAVQSLGYTHSLLPSGAGHDAQCLAATAEVGMLFVPSVGGISHAPDEFTRDEDVIAGTRSLAGCWWQMASKRQEGGADA